jgi:uncharacterized membrane protein YvbJ
MKTVWKEKRLSSTENLERRLTRAIERKDRDQVESLLDRLQRKGVQQGFAVEAAKRFISKTQQKRRR